MADSIPENQYFDSDKDFTSFVGSMIYTTKMRLLIDKEAMECNPTLFSVFLKSQLEIMTTYEIGIYLMVISIAALFNILSLVVINKSKVFHNNFRYPIWWTQFAWFELALGKCLTILYQQAYLDDETNNTGRFLLALSASTHYHAIFLLVAAPSILVVERSFATHYLIDYEQKKRQWILISLLFFHNTFAGFFTILTLFNWLRYIFTAVVGAFSMTVATIGFIYLARLNASKLRTIMVYKHNLSTKYQLRENIRIFKLIQKLVPTFLVISLIIITFKTIPMTMNIPDDKKLFFRKITDLIVHAGPIYTTLIMLASVEDYGKIARRILGFEKMPVAPSMRRTETEGDIYFQQFDMAIK